MAKPKWVYWVEDENLEKIKNWAAKGLTNQEIAKSMGINQGTLYVWQDEHPEIRETIKKGRLLSLEVIENALFKKATGTTVVEETEEFNGEIVDGKPTNGTVKKRKVVRHVPPDTGAAIFYLKNRAPDLWSDHRSVDVTGAPTITLGVVPKRADDDNN